jgi:hypothetical protein
MDYAHSYFDITRRVNPKPYFKIGRTGPAGRATKGGGPWNVPDLCAAYNWPSPGSVPWAPAT